MDMAMQEDYIMSEDRMPLNDELFKYAEQLESSKKIHMTRHNA